MHTHLIAEAKSNIIIWNFTNNKSLHQESYQDKIQINNYCKHVSMYATPNKKLWNMRMSWNSIHQMAYFILSQAVLSSFTILQYKYHPWNKNKQPGSDWILYKYACVCMCVCVLVPNKRISYLGLARLKGFINWEVMQHKFSKQIENQQEQKNKK